MASICHTQKVLDPGLQEYNNDPVLKHHGKKWEKRGIKYIRFPGDNRENCFETCTNSCERIQDNGRKICCEEYRHLPDPDHFDYGNDKILNGRGPFQRHGM